jgi:methylenetetrahydrofolate reductase (NADPH)
LGVAESSFEIISEIEPATQPDLRRIRHQIGVLSAISSTFLIPDNHLGRATVSSIAVAREVIAMGGQAIACLNARDRNTLGFRRDLLTAAAYGVEEFLFVYGDRPETGRRSDDLTVRRMLDEARRFAEQHGQPEAIRVALACGLGPVPQWKLAADGLFVQVSFSVERLLEWRASLDYEGKVYAGVMVIASSQMANKLASETSQITVPEWLVERLEGDPDAGLEKACRMVAEIASSGLFSGVHLIPVRRYREVAARLESSLD